MPEAVAIAVPGQPEAERVLGAALREPRHAYLLHGPAGTGKEDAARALAAALLGCPRRRVDDESHPDLAVLDADGERIAIDDVRAIAADAHMRPFEAERRVYLVREAERLEGDAAHAILKVLEEPPPYVVFLLVCNRRERLLDTVASRCQAVRFRPLGAAACLAALRADGLDDDAARRVARIAGGDLVRARRLGGDAAALAWEERLFELARDALLGAGDAGAAAREVAARGTAEAEAAEAAVRERRDAELATVPEHLRRELRRVERRYDELARRRRRRAETEVARRAVDVALALARDALVACAGAEDVVVRFDRPDEVRAVAARLREPGARAAIAAAQATRKALGQPVIPGLALEAMYVGLASSPTTRSVQ